MADQQGPPPNNIYPVHFPTLARRWDPFTQQGTMKASGDGPLWREMINLQLRDGHLERRPMTDDISSQTAGQYGVVIPEATFTTFDGDGEVEPREQNVLLIFDFDHRWESSPVPGRVIVTDQEIFCYHRDLGWENFTPVVDSITLATTVTTVNGDETLEFSDTFLEDMGIEAGHAITLDGDSETYEIASITDGDTLELVSPYGGTGGSGEAWQIRRVHNMIDNHVFATFFNGNLYVGGHIGSHDSDGFKDSAILVWENINSQAHSGASGKHVFCGEYQYDMTSTCDVLGYACHIKGFQIMPDGRIVSAGSYNNSSTVDNGNGRIWYSSHLDQQVYNLSPGGAFDVVSQQSEISAMGSIAGGYSVHFMDGISMLVPTGLDDPPLQEYSIDSDVGSVGPRLLSNNGKVELFISSAWQLHAFDGSSTEALSRVPRYIFEELTVQELSCFGCADVDSHRGHYHALCKTAGPTVPGTGQPEDAGLYTKYMVSDFRTGNIWPYQWTFPVYSIYLSPLHEADLALRWARQVSVGLIGTSTYTSDAFDSEATGVFALLEEGNGTDIRIPGTPRANEYAGFYAISDDQDLDLPGRNKYIHHVTLWYTGENSGEDIDIFVAVTKDGGTTWDVETTQVSPGTALEHYNFFFDESSGENWRIAIGLGDAAPFDGDQDWEGGPQFVKMTVWAVPEGDVEYYA